MNLLERCTSYTRQGELVPLNDRLIAHRLDARRPFWLRSPLVLQFNLSGFLLQLTFCAGYPPVLTGDDGSEDEVKGAI